MVLYVLAEDVGTFEDVGSFEVDGDAGEKIYGRSAQTFNKRSLLTAGF